jgi:glutamyl endopeptidase
LPTKGHHPIQNTDSPPDVEAKVVLESAQPQMLEEALLPNYVPVRSRRARPAEVINESFPPDPEPAVERSESGDATLLDAADGSYGETTVLEAVIGNDDRIRVADAFLSSNPWRQICALRIHASTGSTFVGTAWFIAPQVLATAGHCVYMIKENGWATSIDVIPAKHGTVEPFGRMVSTLFATVDGWVNGPDRDFDYGVIFVDDPDIGQRVGNFAVDAASDADLTGALAHISGYPFDRDRAEFQYYHARPISDVTPTRLDYDVDTFGGQSGSPIWRQPVGASPIAIGIHTTGSVTGNSGTRISEPVIDNLIHWVEKP